MSETIHVSVAWPYANGDMHVGHLAGAYLPADIFARYHRLKGNRVLMVSGSDSHGTPITIEADAQGISPRDLFEHYHHRFVKTQLEMGISYDLYTHTDTENHHRIVRDFFLKLYEGGYLYQETQQQFYSEAEDRFLADRFVEGTCPICGYEEARGDQCDQCGSLLDALDLINPRSKTDGSKPIIRETDHYFFDLPKFSEMLLKYLDKHQNHWRPNVLNFTRNFIESGLKGRAVTRDVEWGIDVPLEGWEDKRIYVWFEAVMGYFTASVEWSHNRNQPEAWKDWWYNSEARIYNFIGKDNIPFHTIFWPAELIGVERIYEDDNTKKLSLPYDVPANEYMNIKGAQFSKSRNWAIWLQDILERYDPDAIRFYITFAMPENRDSEFSWTEFVRRNNDELVATWGNLANRVLAFTYKHWEGNIPEPGETRAYDQELIEEINKGFDVVGGYIEEVKLRAALQECFRLAREVNAYLDHAPWFGVIKEDRESAATTVFTALQAINSLKILLSPFLPFSSELLHSYLGYKDPIFGTQEIVRVKEDSRDHETLTYNPVKSSGRWAPSGLKPGTSLKEPKPLFKKFDDIVIEEENERLGKPRK